MGRRTVLLIVAAVVAVLGSGLVFLYVQGIEKDVEQDLAMVGVLEAVAVIEPGETLNQAQAAGKIAEGEVPQRDVLEGAVNSIGTLGDQVALGRIFPGEQIIAGKFGSAGEQSLLNLDDGNVAISVNLSDTGRVAGFVSPGAKVALFLTSPDAGNGENGVRVLLPEVQVIAVGATTVTTSTTTTQEGAQTTEQLPKTLFTLSVNQEQAQKVIYAASNGELTFALLNDKSKVEDQPATVGANLFR